MTGRDDVDCKLAIILAAGRGRRMGTLTADQPKCLCPLAGRPIIAWTVDALRANGIDHIVAVGGWQHRALDGWVDQVVLNPRWEQTNMVRSLQLAHPWLRRENALIVYGDGAYGQRAIRAALHAIGDDIAVPVDCQWLELWQRRFANPLDDAETLVREGSRLVSVGSRASGFAEVQGQFMGLLRTSAQGWARIGNWLDLHETEHGAAAVDRLDTTGLLQGLLQSGESISCIEVSGGWVEIDSMHDLSVAEEACSIPGLAHDFRR